MGEWTILERLLEAAVQQHSTMIGRILLTVVVIFRILIVAIVGETVYEDEQTMFTCNTLQPGLQPGLLRQGLPHLPHPLLGLPDHPGLHAQPLLHHLLGPPVGQAPGPALFLPPPAAGEGRPEGAERQRDPGAQPRGLGQGGARLPGGQGAAQRPPAAAQERQGQAAGGHLPLLHHPGGLPQRAGDRLPGGPVRPVRLPRAGHLRVRPLPLRQGGGVLRLPAHREDRLPALHVRRERDLRAAQPGRAQPPGLAQDPDGRAGRAGPAQVGLRGAQEGPGGPGPGATAGPDPVQRVRLRL
ncbi:unnamed protein product, partial [Eretmochelys imbricata]